MCYLHSVPTLKVLIHTLVKEKSGLVWYIERIMCSEVLPEQYYRVSQNICNLLIWWFIILARNSVACHGSWYNFKNIDLMCLAQWVHFLQHLFQMTTFALMMHLNPTSEVVNHPDTHFVQHGMHLLSDGHFEFSNGLWIVFVHAVLQ